MEIVGKAENAHKSGGRVHCRHGFDEAGSQLEKRQGSSLLTEGWWSLCRSEEGDGSAVPVSKSWKETVAVHSERQPISICSPWWWFHCSQWSSAGLRRSKHNVLWQSCALNQALFAPMARINMKTAIFSLPALHPSLVSSLGLLLLQKILSCIWTANRTR